MILRQELENREAIQLKKYACFAKDSFGRKYPQSHDEIRTCFQRDRGRIIHSSAFRRLEYKTQVFANYVGDHYRTRLTHSLEVAQIARTIAVALGLNSDLAEAIALCHDLGHPPYGHAGEDCLQILMSNDGGFEHNLQSLRIVDLLDHSYKEFPGLNLSYELRASLWLHSHKRQDNQYKTEFNQLNQPPLEGQIVDLADSLAYIAHDLEDGLRSNILQVSDLQNLHLWKLISHAPQTDFSGVKHQYRQRIGLLINILVNDLLQVSQLNIAKYNPKSWLEISNLNHFLIAFSPEIQKQKEQLHQFLFDNFYRHPKVNTITEMSKNILTTLFDFYLNNPQKMPPFYYNLIQKNPIKRVCCDYVSGMTDRFAWETHQEITK